MKLREWGIRSGASMRLQKVILAAVALMSGSLAASAANAQAQPRPGDQGPEGLSSARPEAGAGKADVWTAEKMRRAEPVPLPKVDPEAVLAEARRQARERKNGRDPQDSHQE